MNLLPDSLSLQHIINLCMSGAQYPDIYYLRPCLFPEKQFSRNHFSNFPVFICHQKNESTENTFMSTEKHFPVNEKHFLVNGVNFSQRKIQLGFQESVFLLAVFVFRKVISGKSLSKLSCVCLPLEKLVNGKHFPVKGKFSLVCRKVFS